MDWEDKPIIKYALLAIVVILMIAGLTKCFKKETLKEETAITVQQKAKSQQPQLAQNTLRKPSASSAAPVVID